MGHLPDYQKGIEREKQKHREQESEAMEKERIEKKIGKEDISAKEVAFYLQFTDKAGENFRVSEKTIKNYINRLCSVRKQLDITMFKNEEGEYIIKPEVHRLFFCLIDTEIVRKRRKNLGYRDNINKQMLKNIDKYLKSGEQHLVKSSNEYINAKLETGLQETFFKLLYLLESEKLV